MSETQIHMVKKVNKELRKLQDQEGIDEKQTLKGIGIRPLYTKDDVSHLPYGDNLRRPFTRGPRALCMLADHGPFANMQDFQQPLNRMPLQTSLKAGQKDYRLLFSHASWRLRPRTWWAMRAKLALPLIVSKI